jgi:uncharacterized protein
VRRLAASFELTCWDKPASPCLSSRIPYGQRVTREKLRQIESGEAFLQELGFSVVRLRHYGDQAVVEVPADRVPDLQRRAAEVQTYLRQLGLPQTVIDPEGFVSGKLNREITP